ncbi:MAG: hypothetical protein AB7G75_32350 [Candidatus Binatia bacterium]
MITECALVPDIFDGASYGSQELCDVYLSNLKEYLLQEALVRDLREGEWSAYIGRNVGWHLRAQELMKKLVSQRRLHPSAPATKTVPTSCIEWCQEALASHATDPLVGIIASSAVAHEFRHETVVSPIEKLPSASWWQARSPSLRLYRATSHYLQHLRLVLRHANSLMFIDPHLDPVQPRYGEFVQLLQEIQRADIAPLIELHRVCYTGSGPQRKIVSPEEWEKQFREKLDVSLKSVGLTVEIFIWDDFHDRYLITDLVGISVPNGFDVERNSRRKMTTWTRLGRRDRDDVQREFDPAAKRHDLKGRFSVGLEKKM